MSEREEKTKMYRDLLTQSASREFVSQGDVVNMRLRIKELEAERDRLIAALTKGRRACHATPDLARTKLNEADEPNGERLRRELTEWLEHNKILSLILDTEHHCVEIDWVPRLPPRIKPQLTIWGSIYVIDDTDSCLASSGTGAGK